MSLHPSDHDDGGAPTWNPHYDAPGSGSVPAGHEVVAEYDATPFNAHDIGPAHAEVPGINEHGVE